MIATPLSIPDVVLLEPKVFGDERGFFFESFNQKVFNDLIGREITFVQDNHSRSAKNVLRGLHYQIEQPQGKLVRVIEGEVFDVAVDIRQTSPSFGKWVSATLSSKNKHQLWIPAGFAHGFLVLSDTAEVLYKATDYYSPANEKIILWTDSQISIDWPIKNFTPITSDKDRNGMRLSDLKGQLE
jgi:dTDP-4-dehydrorhamnose 3,5-epimerase